MMLPMIGITTINTKNPVSGAPLSTNGWTYNDAVTKGGGVPFLLPSVTNEDQLDAMVEVIELIDYPYGLGIQWHPEAMLVASDDMLPVFTGLIEAAKKAADK